ncbi:tripartite tricarboxylate transporter TctB family protein [Mycobacterium neglectum]|uniref:tripartite tricarboxylate transporter TctB family protein n=1 Tax=Mycobacterium neglectum TaxID=242737 RepID=UPI000BFEF3C5|nr:tripartite tricarboxylate transporter TctB family protein [Mycobacterium neglectum]
MSQRVDADGRHKWAAKREDAIGGMVVLGLAAVILIGGLAIPDSSYANAVLSPRDFPWFVGLLMAVAGTVLLVRNAPALVPSHRSAKTGQEDGGSTADDKRPEDAEEAQARSRPAQNPRTLGILLSFLLGYILVFVWLGYTLSTFLFLAGLTMVLAPRKPARNLIFAATFSIVVYLGFTKGLNVLLPPGPLGGLL